MNTRKEQASGDVISIVQRGNLKALEKTLRKQWRLGQNIVLCWSPTDNGIMVLLVPHYFLGNYSAAQPSEAPGNEDDGGNEGFIRQLISGRRRKSRDEFFAIASRLGVSTTFIKLSEPLAEDAKVVHEVEQIIKRYGISYVSSRAVLLFDIAEFSLYTPFEQASQLNSLSYSMNSAYNKLLAKGVEINFARTTTGDGYYVWNRNLGDSGNEGLFQFLQLVLVDNAIAQAASNGNTVPVIRSAYHIGSHYELYQAEGVNPTVFSYIVGDVTIELARMVDLAEPGQVFVGDFSVSLGDFDEDCPQDQLSNTEQFLDHCNQLAERLHGIPLSGDKIASVNCFFSSSADAGGNGRARRFALTDKHGLTRDAFNMQLEIVTESGRNWQLGLPGDELPDAVVGRPQKSAGQA